MNTESYIHLSNPYKSTKPKPATTAMATENPNWRDPGPRMSGFDAAPLWEPVVLSESIPMNLQVHEQGELEEVSVSFGETVFVRFVAFVSVVVLQASAERLGFLVTAEPPKWQALESEPFSW